MSPVPARQRIGVVGEGAGAVGAEGGVRTARIEGRQGGGRGLSWQAGEREEHRVDDAEAGELDGEVVGVALPRAAAAGFVHDCGREQTGQ